jgi:hypothetical protein
VSLLGSSVVQNSLADGPEKMASRKRTTICLRIDRRCSLGLVILIVSSYSSELSLSFGAVMLATGLATVMNERMEDIHRDIALIQRRNAEIRLEYSMWLGGEDEDDSDRDSDRDTPTLTPSPWVRPISSL